MATLKYLITVSILLACVTADASKATAVKKAATELVALMSEKFGKEGVTVAHRFAEKHPDVSFETMAQLTRSVPPDKVHVLDTLASAASPTTLDEIASVAARNPGFFDIVADPKSIRFISGFPDLAAPLYRTLKACPGQQTLEIFESCQKFPGGEKICKELLPNLGQDHLIHLHRVLNGKTYKAAATDEIITISKNHLHGDAVGELTEQIAQSAVNSRRVPGLDLKDGTQLIPGKYNSRNGIDFVGVTPNRKPLILEVTSGKDFSKEKDAFGFVQMSPEWVADRWNRFVENPANLAQLEQAGVDARYLRTVTPDFVSKEFSRKLLLPKSGSVEHFARTGMNGTTDIVRF